MEILAKEAAEVVQATSKIQRFGIDDYHPKNKMPNRQYLEREIGHFLGVIDILLANRVIKASKLNHFREEKLGKTEKWYLEPPKDFPKDPRNN